MFSLRLADSQLRASNWGLLGVYGFVCLIGLRVQQTGVWSVSALFVLLSSLVAWLVNLKRFRAVLDTPTSKVFSAPLGYVELCGRGKQPPGDRLFSYRTGLPCLWYRYSIERKSGDKWVHMESGESHDTFGLQDTTGLMLIDPDGAEILTSRKEVWIEGDYRNTEWTLIEGEPLYALGEHVTLGGAQADLDRRGDISALLGEWKRDKPGLLKRFDHNQDGEIDMAEWALARSAATLEVERTHFQVSLEDGVHVLRKPRDGRPFLVANRLPRQLVQHYQIWSWVYLGFTFASLGLIPWMLR
ncbi:MAG TPA: hypothetical protein VEP67_08470 [Thiobacillaceae bacterium]|nr:hypothetical protein [Thiobacillaceae bacterium]